MAAEATSAAEFVPASRSLAKLRHAAGGCRGCAGGLLAKALESAGIDAGAVYLTNAVKHFKWRARGKRRLHQTPRAGEVEACRPWLEAELEAVKPTALLAPVAALTMHPSAILRLRDRDEREDALASLVDDLRLLAASAAKHG